MTSVPSRASANQGWNDILQGFRTQVRVIHALVMRETMTRYGDHQLGFLWAILQPLAMVMVFVVIFSTLKAVRSTDAPIAIFMICGIVPFTIFTDIKGQLQNAIGANKAMLGFPQVTTFDVIMARAILETLVGMGVFILLLSLFYVAGVEFRIEKPLMVLGACGLIISIGLGLGFVLASLKPMFPSVQVISSTLLGRPLFLTSGVFFSAEQMPAEWRHVLLYNPLLHCTELIRNSFFYEIESPYGSWMYAGAWAGGLLLFGMVLHKAVHRRAVVGI